MKKTATHTINDKVITINEVTVRQLLNAKESFGTSSVIDAIVGLLPILTDATPEFLLELAPSELEELYAKVKEVNSAFFRVIPLETILVGYKNAILETITKSLSTQFAESLQQGTA